MTDSSQTYQINLQNMVAARKDKWVGAHVSAAGGAFNAPYNARAIGAEAFGLFVKNQKQWFAKPLSEQDVAKFKEAMDINRYSPEQVLPHASYLINAGHPDDDKRKISLDSLVEEMRRCEQFGLTLLNFHPGATLKKISEEECIENVARTITQALTETESCTLVIENTAGQGSCIGYKLEHLAEIIDRVEDKTRIGVCIDTCHAFVAGYNLKEEPEKFFQEFDNVIGFEYLKGMHLNGAMKEMGSRKDRHHSLHEGFLGVKVFELIAKQEHFNRTPLILETINPNIWRDEIEFIYSMCQEG